MGDWQAKLKERAAIAQAPVPAPVATVVKPASIPVPTPVKLDPVPQAGNRLAPEPESLDQLAAWFASARLPTEPYCLVAGAPFGCAVHVSDPALFYAYLRLTIAAKPEAQVRAALTDELRQLKERFG